ncbi:MAG: hypothetical protein ACK4E0_05665 [Chitinophagaceae bacterium]
MKTFFALVLTLIFSCHATAQYYFDDFRATADLETAMKGYLNANVASFVAIGYDQRGNRNRDFQETHTINTTDRSWRKVSRNGFSVIRQTFRFSNNGLLSSISDSSNGITTLTEFEYGMSGITAVNIIASDSASEFNRREKRLYQYSPSGVPVSLLRIIDDRDTIRFKLIADEKNRIVEERLDRPGSNASNDFVYYYYNDQDQLTDLVRYDKFLKKLMPERMFEYDAEGRVIQMITMLSTRSGDFLTWRYAYNSQGLKSREALFNRQREQTGRIDFSYSFSQ